MSINYYTDTSEDLIDAEEYQLYEAIMAYRASLGLSSIPLSQGLTITASRHVLDTVYNIGHYDGHNWSDAPYDANNSATYPNIWEAPQRVGSSYPSNGYEISTGYVGDPQTLPDMDAETALTSWQNSPSHNDIITQQGSWDRDWQAIGVAIHESVAHVWFGHDIDPSGAPGFVAGVGPVVVPPSAATIIGTGASDVLYGTDGADIIDGGTGSDVHFAGPTMDSAGMGDTARFSGASSAYTIVGGLDYATITDANGVRDKTFAIEFLQFDDRTITLTPGSALDGAGAPEDFVTAERVALLYEAALNRDGNIDLPGLNFYIGVTERDGLSDEFLARDLMNSPEFTASFGDIDTLSNAAFLEQIYLNVLDRASDAAGRQFYLDLLNANTITKELALADIAVSPENTVESTTILMGLHETAEGDWAFL